LSAGRAVSNLRLLPGLFRQGEMARWRSGAVEFHPSPEVRGCYPELLAGMIWRLADQAKLARPFLVGLSGARDSSKSTTAARLTQMLDQVCPTDKLSLDNYLLPAEFFAAQGIDITRQAKDPVGIDFARLRRDLASLRAGRQITLRTRDRRQSDYRGSWLTIDGGRSRIVVEEGLSALLPSAPGLDLKIFLEISADDAERLLFNKPNERRMLGLSSLSDQQFYERFLLVERPRFSDHYLRCRANADLIVKLFFWAGQFQLSQLTVSEEIAQHLANDEPAQFVIT